MSKKLMYIVFFWLLFSVIAPNIGLSVTEKMGICARVANVLLPLGIAGILFSLSSKLGKTIVWCIPLYILGAFQIVLLSLYGEGVIAVDMFLNLVTTNAQEAGELLSNMLPTLVVVALIYLPLIIIGIYMIYKNSALPGIFRKYSLYIFSIVAACGLAFFIASYELYSDYKATSDLYPANVCYNIYLACKRTAKTSKQPDTSAGYKYDASSNHDGSLQEIYILVIGETSRASNWQLSGYSRPTNPRLSNMQNIIYFKDAMSESNTTHKSVPMLLSPVSSESFDKEIYNAKSLITAFKEAGHHTAFISNQLHNRSFIDYFGYEADTTVFVRENMPEIKRFDDSLLIPALLDVLGKDNKKQLVVLHTYGSHFNYTDRYESSNAKFLPDKYAEATKDYRKELINAYDNTILGTDIFLSAVIDTLTNRDVVSAMIYASDHGEDIYDNGRSFLHASPTPTIEQLHVPFFVWLSDKYISQYPEAKENLEKNSNLAVSTSRSYCPTALNIAGIESVKIVDSEAVSSSDYKTCEPLYLNDHNKAVKLKTILK